MEVKEDLKSKYNSFYSNSLEKWRELGAITKVNNIVDVLDGKTFDNVIEVGAGDGNLLLIFDKLNCFKKLTAAEISESGINQIKKKSIKKLVEVQKFDGYKLPYRDNEFDLAVCSHVLEHVEHERTLLRELKRISKKQVIEIPIDFSFFVDKKFKHYNDYGHINIYTPALFRFLLLGENFKILNQKFSMYSNDTIEFQFKNNFKKRFFAKTKKTIWNIFSFLKLIKPNAYTVLVE